MSRKKHPLHEQVAETIFNIGKAYSFKVIVDKDCKFKTYVSIDQQLPFYLSLHPAKESTVSMVDLILIKNNNKIKLVCEIEESGFNPTKIFGKLFSTASAKNCRLKDSITKYSYYELDDNSVFIQVILSKHLKEKSKKIEQGRLIEKEILNKLHLYDSWIKHYRLIYGEVSDFIKPGSYGYDEIEKIIKVL